ncbi:hypothetical protein JHK85_055675 [Glycine max]|nr:hypothetical protein JHK85_055675 [Glycine max]
MFSVSMANKDWSFGFNYTDWWSRFGNHPQNKTQQQPRQILVGGSEHWHYGFNYTDWAFKTAPFYLNDTLVFKYDAPNATSFPHSVYMFKSFGSFLKCDIKKAKMLANPTQGSGEGFKFVLKKWQPHYFACGERNGFHCNNVFKYDAPNATSFPHSVYMFKSFGSFLKCDIKKAKMLANPTQGSGEGFKFVLKKWQPHYFACGERNGFHCNNGTMKFAVMPMFRPFWKWP